MDEKKKKKVAALKKELDAILGDSDSQALLDIVEEVKGQTERFGRLERAIQKLGETKDLSEIKELVSTLIKLLKELDITIPEKFKVDVDNWPEPSKGTKDVKVTNLPKQTVLPKSIEVSNLPKQEKFPKKIEVSNLPKPLEFPKKIDISKPDWFKQLTKEELASVISETLNKLNKQGVAVDLDKYRDPKQALAVRLSDGRKFYQALAGVVEAMGRGQDFPFKTIGGTPKEALVERDGTVVVTDITPTGAFGERKVAENTPVLQIQYPYNLNTDLNVTRDNQSGASSVSNNLGQVSSGAAANSSAMILSRRPFKYNPGQGGLHKFSGLFSTPAANNTQEIGLGDVNDCYSFAYDGTTFGILLRRNGRQEVRRLAITAASTDIDNLTITLDGTAEGSIAVTAQTDDAAGRTVTAGEIAAHDFSNVGLGWEAHSMGANVFFHAYDASVRTGTYEITTASTAAGTFSQSLAGVAPTETRTAQADWNVDKMDGSGPSEMTLDPTKGNVYQIQYQWLGFGPISFFIEDDDNKRFQLVHRVNYSNQNTVPSITNPSLPMYFLSKNTSNTSDIVVKVGSHSAGSEGRIDNLGVPKSTSVNDLTVTTSETPLFTIHSHDIYKSLTNRVEVILKALSASTVGGTKAAIIRIRRNATLTGGSFSAIDSNTSTIHLDTG